MTAEQIHVGQFYISDQWNAYGPVIVLSEHPRGGWLARRMMLGGARPIRIPTERLVRPAEVVYSDAGGWRFR